SNIALEVDCTLARGLQESKALQPLLCEDEWNNALPLQIRDNVSLKLGQDTCQDARDVFAGFDYHQPFSVTYMNWMVNHLIPRVMRNTGIPSDDLLLASLIQLFHTERQLPEHIAHMTPHEQFEHNYPNSSPEQRTEIGLKAFEFLLRRLQELTTFHQKHVDVPDAKEPRTIMREILLIAPSCPSRELMDWTIQFSRHLENAGLKVSLWSGHGDLPQPIPCAVITVCTPELKNTVEAGLEQLASVWGQLQHHLAKPDVVCFPIIYEGDYGTAVPNWSKNYHSPWPKNFLARNTDGNSLALSQSHYYKLMIGIKPKGLLRDLLDYRDNDPCYNLLLHIFQRMRAGWGTKELLVLEEASLAKAGIQVQVNDASVQNHAVCL
ncbi:MAG: hypothetical protein K0Q74_1622, partial [Gammaproteobacteria bacterium]|nr:hypothetical protein [Gammaproteobacteria bacterium]